MDADACTPGATRPLMRGRGSADGPVKPVARARKDKAILMKRITQGEYLHRLRVLAYYFGPVFS